ncbi:phenylalanyl-tRNA synthetase subunit alpha [Escherichia coli]|nr:phenylalanyl-tRNA synthetase subunit alpha [Escherichia coli]
MFHQMEGLIVDTNISFTNLKGTLHDFLRNFFEEDLQIRSVLPTSRSPSLLQKLTSWVKTVNGWKCWVAGWCIRTCWRNVGIDPEVYSGFAFGDGDGASDYVALRRHRPAFILRK